MRIMWRGESGERHALLAMFRAAQREAVRGSDRTVERGANRARRNWRPWSRRA